MLPDKRQQQYEQTVTDLRLLHQELLKLEQEGKFNDSRDTPVLIEDYITKLSLKLTLLYSFENELLDRLNDQIRKHAQARQKKYEEYIMAAKKPSVSAAENNARETTRDLEVEYKITENHIRQVRNERDRFEKILMPLQSRLKSFNAERLRG